MMETPKDPLAMWRELVSQWETGFNTLANKVMGSDEFSRAMNQSNQMSIQVQQSMAELMARYLALLNLPSRGEFANISERLQAIEDGVNRIAAALERNAAAAPETPPQAAAAKTPPPAETPRPRPARTRKPAPRTKP